MTEVKRHRLFMAACAGMFVFGIVFALLGTLFGLPQMRERLHVNLAQQGDLFLLLFIAVGVSTLASGPLIDRFGNKLVLLTSSVLVTIALVQFSFADSMLSAAIAASILGLGGGGINNSANVLVSELYQDNRAPMMNVLGVFYGIGALFMPFLAASITAVMSMSQLLLISAALPAACAVAYAVLPFPPAREGHGMSLRELLEVVRYPGLFVFAFLMFFESGNEAVLGGWTSTYLGSIGATARTATYVLAAFWGALMVGRICATHFLTLLRDSQLVFTSAVCS